MALARVLVVRQRCLFLDEPLSELDARLRVEMPTEIRRLCKEFGLTAINVTHDQKEALSIANRMAVIHSGRVAQCGSPEEVYPQAAVGFRGGVRLSPKDMSRLLQFVGSGVLDDGRSLRMIQRHDPKKHRRVFEQRILAAFTLAISQIPKKSGHSGPSWQRDQRRTQLLTMRLLRKRAAAIAASRRKWPQFSF